MGTIIGATLGNVELGKMGMGSALMCIPIYIYYALVVVYIGVGLSALKKTIHNPICGISIRGFSLVM